MNLNFDVVNRAFTRIGEEPITEKDKEDKNLKWNLAKNFYLVTILEALSTTPWTSSQKHAVLELSEEENYTKYQYAYKLPLDCAKPLELQDNSYYQVIGKILYADIPNAVLRYVSNFKKVIKENNPEEDIPETDIEIQTEEIIEEDYPEYAEIIGDVKFWEYIELRMASKLALKLSGDMNLYNVLYAEARLIENEAIAASKSNAYAKKNGNNWWLNDVNN